MLSIVKSMSLLGLDGCLIYVQVDVSMGIPGWDIVGLPDTSVKEAKERVRTAIKNSGYELQSRKIIVLCTGVIGQISEDIAFIGELSLDGKINKVNGILPMCIEAKKLGIKQVILPKENAQEAAVVDELDIYGANTLGEVVDFLNGNSKIEKSNVDIEKLFKTNNKSMFDFNEVKGQENIKRALEIAAAGRTQLFINRKSRLTGKQ